MSLLELEHVSKAYGRLPQARVVLNDVSLDLDAGELATVWGMRRSGRSTLLRVAAGIEAPDKGIARVEGRSLTARGGEGARTRIGYCRKTFAPAGAQTVLGELLEDPLACGIDPRSASRRVHSALERTGAGPCSTLRASELDAAQRVRVAIARALLLGPRLLVIDEPTLGVGSRQRNEILLMLRSLANDGMAVLTSADSDTGLLGADRGLALAKGRLRGELEPELAEVVPLPRSA
jgi:putative ABC transport system ATP-binding protein